MKICQATGILYVIIILSCQVRRLKTFRKTLDIYSGIRVLFISGYLEDIPILQSNPGLEVPCMQKPFSVNGSLLKVPEAPTS